MRLLFLFDLSLRLLLIDDATVHFELEEGVISDPIRLMYVLAEFGLKEALS